MKINKFLAVVLSILLFTDFFLLFFITIMWGAINDFLLEYKLIIRAVLFIGGAFIAGVFYNHLKGNLSDEEESDNNQAEFEINRNKLIAISIVIFIFIFSIFGILFLFQ